MPDDVTMARALLAAAGIHPSGSELETLAALYRRVLVLGASLDLPEANAVDPATAFSLESLLDARSWPDHDR